MLAAVATGQGPDFGGGTAGKAAALARDDVVVPLDDRAVTTAPALGCHLYNLTDNLTDNIVGYSRILD